MNKPIETTNRAGQPVTVQAVTLYDQPAADGSYGAKTVNGNLIPIQKAEPIIGVVCAACGKEAPHPLEFDGKLYCCELCAHEAGQGDFDPRVIASQRRKRQEAKLRTDAAAAGMTFEAYVSQLILGGGE